MHRSIATDERSVTVTLFMANKSRARYHRPRPPGAPLHFRNQQYAPPTPMLPATIELFVAGDARKKNASPPPAGCGVVAVEHGSDERRFTICEPVTTAMPGVQTVTS